MSSIKRSELAAARTADFTPFFFSNVLERNEMKEREEMEDK